MSFDSTLSSARKHAGLALASLSLAFLSACGQPANKIGADATSDALRGTTVGESVFNGGPANLPHTTINGSALRSDARYTINGTLTITGDVPSNTRIDVNNGRLIVTGNIGDGSKIDVQLPIITHDETTYVPMPMTISCGQNCTTTIYNTVPITSTYIDGLRYPADTQAAVTISGVVGSNVQINSNGRVQAGGWDSTLSLKADHGASRAQVSITQPRAPGS